MIGALRPAGCAAAQMLLPGSATSKGGT